MILSLSRSEAEPTLDIARLSTAKTLKLSVNISGTYKLVMGICQQRRLYQEMGKRREMVVSPYIGCSCNRLPILKLITGTIILSIAADPTCVSPRDSRTLGTVGNESPQRLPINVSICVVTANGGRRTSMLRGNESVWDSTKPLKTRREHTTKPPAIFTASSRV